MISEPIEQGDFLTNTLPNDLLYYLLTFLSVKVVIFLILPNSLPNQDIVKFSRLNRYWRILCNNDNVWRELVHRDLKDAESYQWLSRYIHHYHRLTTNIRNTETESLSWRQIYQDVTTKAVFADCASSLRLSEDGRSVYRVQQTGTPKTFLGYLY